MPRYKLVVMSKPVDGREEEYNDWYQNVHLQDLLAIDAVKSAQRFRLNRNLVPDSKPLSYLTIYEVETDDVDAMLREMMSRAASGRMATSTALSTEESFCALYEEFGSAVKR